MRNIALCLVIISVATFPGAASGKKGGAAGSLDATFGANGLVTTDFGGASRDVATAVAFNPVTSKTIVVGQTCSGSGCVMSVAQYDASGALDPTFGAGGRVTTSFGKYVNEIDAATAVAVDPYDSLPGIYVAGRACPYIIGSGNCYFGLAHYNDDGSLDGGFGSGGLVTTDIGAITGSSGWYSYANGIAIDGIHGYVAVGGETCGPQSPNSCYKEFAVAVYFASNGQLYTNFGNLHGVATTDFGAGLPLHSANATGIAFDASGDLIAAGTYLDYSTNRSQFAVACYLFGNGAPCPAFAGGTVLTSFPNGASATASGMTVGGFGTIAVAGTSGNNFAVARYRPDGSLDPTFNQTGIVTTSFGHNVSAAGHGVAELVVNGVGDRIVVAGSAGDKFAMAAYNGDGSLAWTTTTSFGSGRGIVASASGVVIDPFTLKVTAAGYTNATAAKDNDFAIARYLQ